MTEHDIQNSIRVALSERGWYTERINVGEGFLIPKALMNKIKAHCSALRGELSKVPYFSTGAVKGRSDLSAIKDGRIIFLEVKNEKGRASDDQKNFIRQMRERYGCPAGVVRSVEDAVKLCEEAGVVHAHWEWDEEQAKLRCSACEMDKCISMNYTHCPWCGALMDEEVTQDGSV